MKLMDIIKQIIINNLLQFWTKSIQYFLRKWSKTIWTVKKGCFSNARDAFDKSLKSHMKRNIDLWHGRWILKRSQSGLSLTIQIVFDHFLKKYWIDFVQNWSKWLIIDCFIICINLIFLKKFSTELLAFFQISLQIN